MHGTHTLDLALLILRLGGGLTLCAHGAQKLFGWFGGGGLSGTAATFERIGFRPGRVNALLAGLGEAGGGLLLALGLLTPLAGAAAASTMLVALSTHVARGFFSTNGGFEYPMTLGIVAVALTLAGPGGYSVDAALNHPLASPWVGVAALVVGVVAALALIARRRAATRVASTSTAG